MYFIKISLQYKGKIHGISRGQGRSIENGTAFSYRLSAVGLDAKKTGYGFWEIAGQPAFKRS
jgi:hypothetical protein